MEERCGRFSWGQAPGPPPSRAHTEFQLLSTNFISDDPIYIHFCFIVFQNSGIFSYISGIFKNNTLFSLTICNFGSLKLNKTPIYFLRRPKVGLPIDPKSKNLNSNRPEVIYPRPNNWWKTQLEKCLGSVLDTPFIQKRI